MSHKSRSKVTVGQYIVLGLIAIYRYTVSYWLGGRCRFLPSCSEYAQQAVKIHGVWRGTILSLRRLGRCHPWHIGGIDCVPCVGRHHGVIHD